MRGKDNLFYLNIVMKNEKMRPPFCFFIFFVFTLHAKLTKCTLKLIFVPASNCTMMARR